MEKPNILSEVQVQEMLQGMPGWQYAFDKLSKEFKFKDFMDALQFINAVAPYCESLDHHPDIHVFYNRILFELQRFDVGGKVTDKDFMVAKEIERLYSER